MSFPPFPDQPAGPRVVPAGRCDLRRAGGGRRGSRSERWDEQGARSIAARHARRARFRTNTARRTSRRHRAYARWAVANEIDRIAGLNVLRGPGSRSRCCPRISLAASRPSVVWVGGIRTSTTATSGPCLDEAEEPSDIAGLADHLEAGCLKARGQRFAEKHGVIGEHDADRPGRALRAQALASVPSTRTAVTACFNPTRSVAWLRSSSSCWPSAVWQRSPTWPLRHRRKVLRPDSPCEWAGSGRPRTWIVARVPTTGSYPGDSIPSLTPVARAACPRR